MPRTGWLALGAVLCGVAFGALVPATVPLLGVVLGAAAVVGRALAVARRTGGAAIAIGAAAITARLLAGVVTGAPVVPPPGGSLDGAWSAQVLALGSTTGGEQRSVLIVRAADPTEAGPTATGPWRAYAWLPRYPPLVPGDR